jgi:hypothetical protein
VIFIFTDIGVRDQKTLDTTDIVVYRGFPPPKLISESRRRVARPNTTATYSGGPWFKSRPGDRLFLIFHGFPLTLRTNAVGVP